MTRKSLIITLAFIVLIGLLIWTVINQTITLLHIASAEEQTEIFEAMVDRASESLSKTPPDVAKSVEYLEYAHNYYPSGTKQISGSKLDRVVERSRKGCEKRIIDLLKKTTGKDIGNDPDVWIKQYGIRK